MEDSSAFLGTKLLVIGDSHAKFWKGHDNLLGEDLLPGVRTREIPGGLAYTLTKEHSTVGARQISLHTIREAIAQGFDGWLLLSFGEIDMRAHAMYHAMYHAISIGVVESVRSIVTQYIAFIHEVRTLHSKVAVWAPIGSHPQDLSFDVHYPTVGTEIERNLATMLYTDMLKQELEPQGIPVLSLLPLLLRDDGTTNADVLHDGVHLSQSVMPAALLAVKEALGITIIPTVPFFAMEERELHAFYEVTTKSHDDQNWLSFELFNTMFIKSIILKKPFNEILPAFHLRLSIDRENYSQATVADIPVPPLGSCTNFSLNSLARFIMISAPGLPLEREDIRIQTVATRIMRGDPGNGSNKATMFEMSRAVVSLQSAEERVPVLA